jgi:hypothetical protein
MKTAVEWFVEQLPIRILNQYHKEIEQAKVMMEEQIIDAYNQADLDGYFQKTYPGYAETYYNQTYEKK